MKLNFMHGALAMGLAALMTACFGGGKPTTETEWFVCSDDEGENYGFFNPGTGKMMYEDEFSSSPTSIIDGVFIVSESDGLSVYSAADPKSPKILGDLDELKDAGGVAEGLLPVCRPNSRIEVYSVSASKAELAFTLDPVDGKEITECLGSFTEGLLLVANEDNKIGAVDKKGNVVIPIEYDRLFPAHNGMMIAAHEDGDDLETYKWYVLNTKGEELFKFKKGIEPINITVNDNGYFVCKNSENGRYVLATAKEEYFNMPKEVESVGDFYGEYLSYYNGKGYGVIKVKNGESEVIVRPKYDIVTLLPWEPAKFVGSKGDNEYVVMDVEGNKIIDFGDDYTAVVPYYTPNWQGFVAYDYSGNSHNSECVFYDTKGEKIKFDGMREFYNLSTATSYAGYVSSHYFNLTEFVRQISDAISTKGLCGYKMGTYANQYYTDDMAPRGYTYTYWFTPKDEPNVKGYRYSSSIRLSAYRSLANSTWDYGTYSTSYYFVPDNPLDGMDLTISCPSGTWDEAGDKIKDAIESKGFTVKTENNNSIQYYTPDRDATLTLSWTSWGSIGLKYYKAY